MTRIWVKSLRERAADHGWSYEQRTRRLAVMRHPDGGQFCLLLTEDGQVDRAIWTEHTLDRRLSQTTALTSR